ncbi:MAG: rane protein [Mycobacterium sp.]|nr:rane protein [Mycobacterium sp.]
MNTVETLLVAVVIAVGLVGILVPLLPGSILVFAAIAVWAYVEGTTVAWVTLGVATAILVAALLVKYLWPMKRMRSADVGTWSLLAGGVLGIVGFFVVPVVGLVLGFVLGVFLAELALRHNSRIAWASTVHAIKGVALSVGVELTGALLATVVWVIGVLLV